MFSWLRVRGRLHREWVEFIENDKGRYICRLKKELWKQEMPEGFRAQKFVKGPDGEYKRDPNFVGENAWDDSENKPLDELVQEGNLNDEEKAELLEILNENRALRGLPPLNSEFKEEMPENDSLNNSDDLITGQFLDYECYCSSISYEKFCCEQCELSRFADS